MAIRRSTHPRRYESALRRQQADETRARILDGLIRTMARGLADVSIPAVAREAGVAVPTVYRHFPTKRDLLAALTAHVERRAGLGRLPPPRSPEELAALLREVFVTIDAMDDELRAASASALGQAVRRDLDLPERHRQFAAAFASATVRLPAVDRRHLLNVVAVLASGHALRAFKDDLGLTAAEAAESAGWAIRALARLAECLGGSDGTRDDGDHHPR